MRAVEDGRVEAVGDMEEQISGMETAAYVTFDPPLSFVPSAFSKTVL